jgi:arabinose-5-phosphate isomerase
MVDQDFDYVKLGKSILMDEAESIKSIIPTLGENFIAACKLISECKGRIACTGVGQSAHVAKKSAASLASLGRPSFFIHPTEAVHGDMGMITQDDVVIFISHSGETKETLSMLSVVKTMGTKTIAIVGNINSTLGKQCDIILSTNVKREAGPIQFAPTSSAIAAIALFDALLSAVAVARGFSEKDYARYHPAGSLGKQLLGDKSL